MDYFRERDGMFYGKAIGTQGSRSPVLRLVVSLFSLMIFASIFLSIPREAQGFPDKDALILGASVFVFANILAFALRKAGFATGMVVDQTKGTLSFRIPGGQRKAVGIDTIDKIVLQTRSEKSAVIILLFKDGTRTPVQISSNPVLLRQAADELSVLTSVTVSEETTSKF